MKVAHSSTRKKVVIRKLDKDVVKGYLDPEAFLTPMGVEMLDLEGRVLNLPLEQIKGVYFVRDFDGHPERSERKVFLSRPRMNGLWVRMTFKDAEVLDGLISENLLSHECHGYFVTMPDAYSNNLKIYIPRSALSGLEVLGVITNGARRSYQQVRQARAKPVDTTAQIGLFPAAERSEAS
ncbi:MAG TPA: hypothetical protein VG028_18880 [Terriglobia bacterium]|nr:hypothetical protein [Terriglobia bacterium]